MAEQCFISPYEISILTMTMIASDLAADFSSLVQMLVVEVTANLNRKKYARKNVR